MKNSTAPTTKRSTGPKSGPRSKATVANEPTNVIALPNSPLMRASEDIVLVSTGTRGNYGVEIANLSIGDLIEELFEFEPLSDGSERISLAEHVLAGVAADLTMTLARPVDHDQTLALWRLERRARCASELVSRIGSARFQATDVDTKAVAS